MPFFLLACITTALFLTAQPSFAADPCLACHEKETPGVVEYWKKSTHFQNQVGCASCHGSSIEANHQRTVTVDAAKCGSCHKTAFSDHGRSKHGIGGKTGRGCTRNQERSEDQQKSCSLCHKPGSTLPVVATECAMFLAQSPAMQRQGCSACHRVETGCDTCHTQHGTDLGAARNPGTCGTCHMGPDHPQLEAWETSRHGVLFKNAGEAAAPSCVTCHMQAGSHNVSKGISSGVPMGSAELKKQERKRMLDICAACHTRAFSARTLDDADRIMEQSSALVSEARSIIDGLKKDGLLLPPLSERPAHPLFGNSLELGPHMLYENLSLVESLFFKMKAFYAATTVKGAFHQNPDYTHWFGNAPLKLALSEIKSEGALLRTIDRLRKRIDNLAPAGEEARNEPADIRKKLRALNEKLLKGEIAEQDYQMRKNTLLDEEGLK